MVFRTKVNMYLLIGMYLVVVIMGSMPLLSLYKQLPFPVLLLIAILFLAAGGIVWWYGTSLQCIFYKEYLLIKGGPFKRRVPYHTITKIAPTTDKFTGYRVTSSETGLELCVETTSFGRIKILTENKIGFIDELKKRCPLALFENVEAWASNNV
ncbi:PH domain-containing protein [Lysinibacillus sp. NPDC097195]|uniref:PH domain-containing protein n=1 Tax=Lysinibacillus sp. NPDC097195 TaxID=3364141 RepID=UPI00380F2680